MEVMTTSCLDRLHLRSLDFKTRRHFSFSPTTSQISASPTTQTCTETPCYRYNPARLFSVVEFFLVRSYKSGYRWDISCPLYPEEGNIGIGTGGVKLLNYASLP